MKKAKMNGSIIAALAIKEAKALKTNATKAELENLSFEKLETDSKHLCVYGQMTGHCESERATELIETSCERVYMTKKGAGVSGKLNGSPKNHGRISYFSPIEVFIDYKDNQSNGNNKRLIDYLTGKTKTLKPNHYE